MSSFTVTACKRTMLFQVMIRLATTVDGHGDALEDHDS